MLYLPNYAKNYAGTIDSSLAFDTGGKFDLLHCGSFLHESNRAALLFSPLPPSLHVMPLSQKVFFFFFSSTMRFSRVFARFSTTAFYFSYR